MKEKCTFCRRMVWRKGPGYISVTCKRHKNKPIYWRFYMAPVVITEHSE